MMNKHPDWDGEDATLFGLIYMSALPVILFWSFILRAWIKLGYQPAFNKPDPKDLGFGIHHALVWGSIALMFVSMCALPVFSTVQVLRNRIRLRHVPHFIIWIGFIAMYVCAFKEFGDWFAD